MENYWIPGVNRHKKYGRWAFAEFTDVYEIEADFKTKIESEFEKIVKECSLRQAQGAASHLPTP